MKYCVLHAYTGEREVQKKSAFLCVHMKDVTRKGSGCHLILLLLSPCSGVCAERVATVSGDAAQGFRSGHSDCCHQQQSHQDGLGR